MPFGVREDCESGLIAYETTLKKHDLLLMWKYGNASVCQCRQLPALFIVFMCMSAAYTIVFKILWELVIYWSPGSTKVLFETRALCHSVISLLLLVCFMELKGLLCQVTSWGTTPS